VSGRKTITAATTAADLTDAELASLPTEVRNGLLDAWQGYPDEGPEYDPDAAYERHLESDPVAWWENEQDRLREAWIP
jgi:hypothetical protein